MVLKRAVILIVIILISYLSIHAQTASSRTGEFEKAYNKELLINIKGDTISAYALVAKGLTKKPTVILISGYPGNDNNFDLGQALRKNGLNVINFNHRGAWGSQGLYNYANCLEDVDYLIDFLCQDDISKRLRINTNQFILVGRSYGAGIALIQGSKHEKVKKIVSISAVNYGEVMQQYSSQEELGRFRAYMSRQIMMNHDIDAFLTEMLENKESYNIKGYKDDLEKKDLLFIEDSSKNKDWLEEIGHGEIHEWDTDHNFVSRRGDMIELIVKWVKLE